jgi:SAM-dependent methyltransferase
MHAANSRAAAGLTALIVLQALWMAPVGSQEQTAARYQYEVSKQQDIYRSKGANVPEGYVTHRGLTSYEELLPSGFGKALRQLEPEDRWLDVGAGQGQAILDYYRLEHDGGRDGTEPRSRRKARAVAVSIEDRRTDEWRERAAALGGDHLRYLSSKRLGEYSNEELGKFRIVTDVYGGLSYTDRLSSFMEKVLGILEVNGDFYSLLQSVRLEDGKDDPQTTWYQTELVDQRGNDVKVCSWLKRITCVQVTCESKSAWDTPSELIHVRKVCNEVSVPSVKPLQYEAGNPPSRVFQVQ